MNVTQILNMYILTLIFRFVAFGPKKEKKKGKIKCNTTTFKKNIY